MTRIREEEKVEADDERQIAVADDRHIHTDRQTDRQTERHRDRQTDRQTD